MEKFSTPQFNKTISSTNGTHADYQRILEPLSLRCSTWILLISKRLEARANRINIYKCFIWAVVLWIKLNPYSVCKGVYFNEYMKANLAWDILKKIITNDMSGSSWWFRRFDKLCLTVNSDKFKNISY